MKPDDDDAKGLRVTSFLTLKSEAPLKPDDDDAKGLRVTSFLTLKSEAPLKPLLLRETLDKHT